MSSPHVLTVTVDYTTYDNGAVAGEDYIPVTGQLIFNPGETQNEISIEIIDDVYAEGRERYGIVLSNPINATIARNFSNEVTIFASDLNLAVNDISVTEGTSTTPGSFKEAEFTVTMPVALDVPLWIYASLVADSADYAYIYSNSWYGDVRRDTSGSYPPRCVY